MSILQTGHKAPSFTLVSSDKKEINLSDYQGKNVILLFFPFAFTGVCTKEMCMMRDDIANYQNLNAEILGISVDSPFTLAKFKEENNLSFPLLSDFNKVASKAYDCLQEDWALGLKGVSKRSVFVIDREGILRYSEILENPGDLPNFEAVNAALAKLNN
ncbi:MAG TPA: peroxiredoxin [Saprospiraceae bacterium]|jgi:peroxiredoxin|nr:peroxiredoxin [Saprospiraceae bacterium]HOJ89975.1 peroxiredoxin [Saprospiraceae bacterium]HUN17390.1 peroxiredoxin [Saprospiraceae bacterium]